MLSSSRLSATALVAFAVFAIVYVISLIQRKWRQYQFAKANNCEVPVKIPSKVPILGLDHLRGGYIAAKNHRFLLRILERFEQYGNTFTTHALGKTLIATREPENIKTILSLKFKDFGLGNRFDTFGPLLGHGIFTTDGEHWAQSRAMIRPNFVKEQVAHLETFENFMGDLFELIPADGSTVDLQDLFFSYTIDTATEFLFGHSIQDLKKRRFGASEDFEADFAGAFNYAQHAIGNRIRFGIAASLFPDPKADRCNRICHKLVEQYVDKALRIREKDDLEKNTSALASEDSNENSKHSQKYLFLHGLAQQTGDRKRIRDELMNVLLAGRDTTASLLSNMFFMIAKDPRIWAKLREEVATLEGRTPTYEQLRNMKYLKYCMNESLRLHPVVPGNGRFAVKDTTIPTGGGPDGKSPVFVPKGAVVGYNVYSMHRRKDIYGPDANEYRPERWETLRTGWEYLPFNGGPRICVGQQYALTEVGYVTVRLAQRFSVLESRDPEPWTESLTLTVCSNNGTKVSLRH